jgi:hemolysin activation/secretion protein
MTQSTTTMALNTTRSRAAVAALLFAALCSIASAQQAGSNDKAAAEERFTVDEYRVLGNTVLPARDIEAALYPTLGEGKTIADVELVRQALEKLYKDHGYGAVYVDIPEQSVDSGIVRLKVTEGRLARVRITGARYFSNGMIRERLPALDKGGVIKLPELQAQLAQVNQQSRDRVITPVLKAGQSPGAVDVELKVQDTLPVHGSIELNDRYTDNTTHTRASINLGYENLFQRFHNLSLQYQTTPEEPSETRVLAATYIAPLGVTGNMLAVYAVDTNSDFAVVSTGGDLAVIGAGRIYGARYIMRLPSTSGYSQSVTLGADYKDFADNIVLPSGITDTTPIKYLAWSTAYGGNLNTERTSTGFSIGANYGLRGLVNKDSDFQYKRFDAHASFLYLRADANETIQLWRQSSAYLHVAGQWSPSPLISNEQFAVGGAESVRGYLESAQLGDTGVNVNLELRSPSAHAWFGSLAQRVMLFAFYDAAHLRQIKQRIEEGSAYDVYTDLSSVGVGLRLDAFSGLQAALDWAYPLKDIGETSKGDSRVHFQVRYGF